jgi:hypothetical protein
MRHGRNASLRLVLLFTAGVLSTGAGADCTGEPSTAGRLTANGIEVYDSGTGLTWARCSVGMNWVEGKGCLGACRTWDDSAATVGERSIFRRFLLTYSRYVRRNRQNLSSLSRRFAIDHPSPIGS